MGCDQTSRRTYENAKQSGLSIVIFYQNISQTEIELMAPGRHFSLRERLWVPNFGPPLSDATQRALIDSDLKIFSTVHI